MHKLKDSAPLHFRCSECKKTKERRRFRMVARGVPSCRCRQCEKRVSSKYPNKLYASYAPKPVYIPVSIEDAKIRLYNVPWTKKDVDPKRVGLFE